MAMHSKDEMEEQSVTSSVMVVKTRDWLKINNCKNKKNKTKKGHCSHKHNNPKREKS